jgi:hypothetical protein
MDMKENIESIRIEKKRPRGKRKDRHIVSFVLPVILTILFPGGGIFYLFGRFSPSAGSFGHVCMLYPVVGVFILWCFFTGIGKSSGRSGKRKRNERLLSIAETAVPLIFVGLLVGSFFLPEAEYLGYGYKFFMCGLKDRIESKADIGATRAWLQSLGNEDYDDHYDRIPHSEWPESVRVLKPGVVFISADENGNAKVRLMWGSGPMGHWGVVIAMKDMKIPPSDFSLYGEYRLPVEPGVYVWWALE